ncbi:MAG: hypothetical protein E7434_01845 [Ruminococcaceae bacterium]|nr:hypothetical protein [Oscillospiraceae bacterium]
MMEYIVIIGILLIGLFGSLAAIAILSNLRKRQEAEEYDDEMDCCQWYVEFWNVAYGTKFMITFGEQVVLGRGLPGETYGQTVGLAPDETIAREQCWLFTYNGRLMIENLATINRTIRNDVQIKVPECLQIGDRITMGVCTFLITDIRCIM